MGFSLNEIYAYSAPSSTQLLNIDSSTKPIIELISHPTAFTKSLQALFKFRITIGNLDSSTALLSYRLDDTITFVNIGVSRTLDLTFSGVGSHVIVFIAENNGETSEEIVFRWDINNTQPEIGEYPSLEQVRIINSGQDYGIINITWMPVQDATFFNLYQKNTQTDSYDFLFSVSSATNCRYEIPVELRGAKIELAVTAYHAHTGQESGFSTISFNTIPSPPTSLRILSAKDNRVELVWDEPTNKNYISGYIVERSLAENNAYVCVDMASVPHYVDVGADYKDPTSLNSYYYRVSAVSYSGQQSSYSELMVFVRKDSITDANTMKNGNLLLALTNRGRRFRVRAIGEMGETPWMVRQMLFCPSERPLQESTVRITAITTDKGASLPVKMQGIISSLTFDPTQPQIFRLRTIDVNGAESNAIQAAAQNIIIDLPYIVNNNSDTLKTINETKLISRSEG